MLDYCASINAPKYRIYPKRSARTEELLGAGLLDDLDDAGLDLLDGGNVVGEDTHLTRLGGDVDLDDILRLVDGLVEAISRGFRDISRTGRHAGSIGSQSSVGKPLGSVECIPGEEGPSSA